VKTVFAEYNEEVDTCSWALIASMPEVLKLADKRDSRLCIV
jgi:hypothetical protein